MAKKRKRRGNKETALANNIFLPEPLYKRDKRGVKTARPDIILTEDELSPEIMQDFIFAEIGGQEILDISRSDFVNSPLNQQYSAIPGTGTSYVQKDPITFSDGTLSVFSSFGILLDNYVPADQTTSPVSIESDTNVLVVKLINVKNSDTIEIDFLAYTEIANDIIFEGI